MNKLQNYLDNEYETYKEELNSIKELMESIQSFYFASFKDDKGWSYRIGDEPPTECSSSTTSMMAFSLAALMGGERDLIGSNSRSVFIIKDNRRACSDLLKKAYSIIAKSKKDDDKYLFCSSTYGENDPFTIMWTKYLSNNIDKFDWIDGFDKEDFKRKIDYNCEEIIKYVFRKIYSDYENLKYSNIARDDCEKNNAIQKSHIFPLLKVVQIYSSMEECDFIEEKEVNSVLETVRNSLHHHLSLASIENSNFDTAEMVFSLEAMLLLDKNRKGFSESLLNRVFNVIRERQKISLYWRPLKPFVLNQQGLALLPVSVEIAMSLIRICTLLGKKGERLFAQNYDIFNHYTEWLKSRVSTKKIGEKRYQGWCSEHIYQSDVIHAWETSQVLVYLANYYIGIEKLIEYTSLQNSGLSIKIMKYKPTAWEKWELGEPINKEGFQVYKDIKEKFLEEKDDPCYSMLLYGPPGTGKSTIAEKIAKTKGWPLITITPSDFIASGADMVETKAKNIFKVLNEQSNMVILFDEIDRLILDRDSGYYSEQSDIFQFMTPSMLVKLKDLRRKKRLIFIVATNYEERIDLAIKRLGRIDKKYLVLPSNKAGRRRIIDEFIKENDGLNWNDALKQEIVNNTALFTYIEMIQALKIVKDDNLGIHQIKEKIARGSISLLNYADKIGISNKDEKNIQKPITDFLMLFYILVEVGTELSLQEKKFVKEFVQSEYKKDVELKIIENSIKSQDIQQIIINGMKEIFEQPIKELTDVKDKDILKVLKLKRGENK